MIIPRHLLAPLVILFLALGMIAGLVMGATL